MAPELNFRFPPRTKRTQDSMLMSSPGITPSTTKAVLTPPGPSDKGEEMSITSRHCAVTPGGERCLSVVPRHPLSLWNRDLQEAVV